MMEGAHKLSEEELYECLKSLNVPTRLSDIKTPTQEFLIRVFECFLKDLLVDIRHQNLRAFSAVKHIEHPEIMEEGQTIQLLVTFINCITSQDPLEIYARDIAFPKPKRTKKILNYLIVFWKYFLMKYANFQAIDEKFQEEKREADVLFAENEKLESEYNECLMVLKNECPGKEELISCNEAKAEKCSEMLKLREEMTEENNASKKKENQLLSLLTKTDVDIVSTKEKIKDLDEVILTSPEKINIEIKKLKDSIHEEEMKCKEKEMQLKEKNKSLEALNQIIENYTKDLEEVQNINKFLQKFESIVKDFIADFKKCQEEKEDLKKLESKLLIKEELQSINENKAAKINLHFKKQTESYNETIQQLQRDFAKEEQDLICLKASKLELDQKMDKDVDTTLKIVEVCKEAEKTTQKLQMDYKSQMKLIGDRFVSECEDLKSYIKEKYL